MTQVFFVQPALIVSHCSPTGCPSLAMCPAAEAGDPLRPHEQAVPDTPASDVRSNIRYYCNISTSHHPSVDHLGFADLLMVSIDLKIKMNLNLDCEYTRALKPAQQCLLIYMY